MTNEKYEWIQVDFGNIIRIGDKSTIISLQDNVSDNLEDTMVQNNNGLLVDINFGRHVRLQTYSLTGPTWFTRTYMKWNISELFDDVPINNVILSLYVNSAADFDDGNYSVHLVYDNVTWAEGNLTDGDCSANNCSGGFTWNTQPCGISFDNASSCDLTAANITEILGVIDGYWTNFNVTSILNVSFENFSIVIKPTDEDSDESYGTNWHSSDYMTNIVLRPMLNITFTTDANVLVNLSDNITELFYPINWSRLNLTAVINHTTGNFTWNLTEYDISAYNLTNWLFNITNNGTTSGNIILKQNQTKDWYEWWCFNINITSVYKTLFSLTAGESKQINCTLNVINISETLVNWSVTVDKAIWDFDWTFNTT